MTPSACLLVRHCLACRYVECARVRKDANYLLVLAQIVDQLWEHVERLCAVTIAEEEKEDDDEEAEAQWRVISLVSLSQKESPRALKIPNTLLLLNLHARTRARTQALTQRTFDFTGCAGPGRLRL